MSISVVGRVSDARRKCLLSLLPVIAVVALLSVSPRAHSDTINTLEQLGIAGYGGVDNLSQIGIGLHDFSYAAGDGSVRTVAGDGSVRFISVGAGINAALCFHGVTVSGSIQDGTSNTILFNEMDGLQFHAGLLTGLSPVRGIQDGTSNTIIFPELPLTEFCIGGVSDLKPVTGSDLTDGFSNTITFGEGSSFDMCLSTATTPTIVDGSSNTILLSEMHANVCLNDIVPAADLTVVGSVPEPAPLALIVSFAAILYASRRRNAWRRTVVATGV